VVEEAEVVEVVGEEEEAEEANDLITGAIVDLKLPDAVKMTIKVVTRDQLNSSTSRRPKN
jgi:hypothetical protein